MSLAAEAGTTVGVLAAAGAVLSLWRGAGHPDGPVRRGYQWFAVAAVFWCVGMVLGQLLSFPVGTAAIPLSLADLPALLALPVAVAGFARLAAAREDAPGKAPAFSQWPGALRVAASVADGYVLASALFLIGWVALFTSAFARAEVGPATFAVELIHPLADMVVLGVSLPLAAAAGRLGFAPYLAVLAMAVSDSLATGARATGTHPGTAALAAAVAAFCLLALAPRTAAAPGRPAPGRPARAFRGATAIAAAGTAGLAALVITGRTLAGGHVPRPVLLAVAGTTVLALALRVLSLVRREHSASRIWQDSDWRFRQLADRTSDVVLLCDPGGIIRYASRAVSDYGYTPDSLCGRALADLVHPEDRAGCAEAVRAAAADQTGHAGGFTGRVRAADGTWRHVESTVSRHRDPAGPDRLLVTARDVSAQVALRRQVTHLTFHDGLTGLPNRAYVEQRARDVLSHGEHGVRGRTVPGRVPIAGVIFLDLDGFTAVNDSVGHSAGDLLLAQVAHRLRAVVPPQDTVARWGGDEFAVLIEGAAGTDEVVEIAEQLTRSVAAPDFRVGEAQLSLTASVGVALSADGPAGYVWRNADLAMSRAKEAGGGRLEVFTVAGNGSVAQAGAAGPVAAD